jgi:hypothetical protein
MMASADYTIYNNCKKPILVGHMTFGHEPEDLVLICNASPQQVPINGTYTISEWENFINIYFFAKGAPNVLTMKTGECAPINQWTVDSLVKNQTIIADKACYAPKFRTQKYNEIIQRAWAGSELQLCCE